MRNGFVDVTIAPEAGGVVTSMAYLRAMTFPFIADRGAQVAGTGILFVPTFVSGTREIDISLLTMSAEEAEVDGEQVVRMTIPVPELGPGVTFQRTVLMRLEESGIRIRDLLANHGSNARDLRVRLGGRSLLRAEPWRMALRCWFGDEFGRVAQFAPLHAGTRVSYQVRGRQLFWRVIGQYGTGFLYQVQMPQATGIIQHAIGSEDGCPAQLCWWMSDEMTLLPGGRVLLESAVLIDEGGREGNDAATLASGDRLIVTADLRAAGMPGDKLIGFGTVVSAEPRRVRMRVSQCCLAAGQIPQAMQVLEEREVTLTPGKGEFVPFDTVAERRGILRVGVTVLDERNRPLGSASADAVIDGSKATGAVAEVWRRYRMRMPEHVFRGTWTEIGAQLAGKGKLRPLRQDDPRSASRMAFYRQHFPYYAEMLEGAAGVGIVPEPAPGDLTAAMLCPSGCMDVFFNGPDGPINAFSKERSGTGLDGLEYVKVLPSSGFRFHTFMNYGVNSEGLSVTGATLNADAATEALGERMATEWQAAGGEVAPCPTWMLLATCRNVEEAIAFFENPAAPVSKTGNVLLVDRSGEAARIETAGLLHQVHRYREVERFLVAGNYAHRDDKGRFDVGERWGWAANTMLREEFLWRTVGHRKNNISLRDVFWLMETHAPGGMCQHIYDNPGLLYSSFHLIAVTRTGELWVSHGPPCTAQYVCYTLNDEE